MGAGLDDVQLEYVDTLDKALALKRWLGERREGPLGVDIETTGLSPFEPGAAIRLFQIGDMHTGWSMSWELWQGLALEVLRDWEGDFVGHNFTAFDIKWIERHSTYRFPRHRLHDTMLAAHIIDPLGPGGLKPLSRRLIDPRAAAGQQLLDDAMHKNKWTWATVPVDFPAYSQYGALDPVLSCRLHDIFQKKVGPGTDWAGVYELELAVRHICTRMEQRGMRLDVEYADAKSRELLEYAESLRQWCKQHYGVSISSGAQLTRVFQRLGADFDVFSAKTGAPSTDKFQLAIFSSSSDAEVAQLAQTVINFRKALRFGGDYLQKFGNLAVPEADGNIVHPSIRTLGARTSRMCLPTSHMLVTRHGVLSSDEIEVGDETIGDDGEWTRVIAVHRFDAQPVTVWQGNRMTFECTDEHRWVTYSPKGVRAVEPLGAKKRQTVVLAPEIERFDFTVQRFEAASDDEMLAALVGLLVTDGRYSEPPEGVKGTGGHAMVYQTERKFYAEILELIPETAISYDRVTDGSDHHEIGIRMRWLRPRLEQAGLAVDPGSSLRYSPQLVPWVAGLSREAVAQFLRAVWLADGRTGHPESPVVSCGTSVHVQRAIRLAAYRLGYRTTVGTAAPGGWGKRPRQVVRFLTQQPTTRNMVTSQRVDDVWCVTTERGTFTAWSDDLGPYLTGNSITDPPAQQLPKNDTTIRRAFIPRDGNVIIATDFAQIEMRLLAHFSKDKDLQQAFRDADASGGDFFVEVGKSVYNDPGFQKPDKRRGLIKNVCYGLAYGAGTVKMAESAGVPVDQMKAAADALTSRFPGIRAFMKEVEHLGVQRERTTGQGFIVTPYGRRLPCDEGKAYTLTNYSLQGHAAEYFKRSLIALDAAGWGDVMLLPVHDEIVMDLPSEAAAQALHDVPKIMENREDYGVDMLAESDGPFIAWGGFRA